MKQNKLGGASLAVALVRMFASLAGAGAFIMLMVKLEAPDLVDGIYKMYSGKTISGESSVFDIFSFLQKFSEKYGEPESFKTVTLILLAVTILTAVFTMFLVIFSFAKFKAKNVIIIIFSLLSAILAVFWIVFVPKAGETENFNISLKAGTGAYIFLGASVLSILLAVIDIIVVGTKADDKGDDETVNPYGDLRQDVIYAAPYMNNVRSNPAPEYTPAPAQPNLYAQVAPAQNLPHTLKAVCGEYAGFDFPLEPGDPIVIGKDPELCSIVLTKNNEFISRKHCTIVNENGEVILIDNSTNGVFVNSQRISKDIPLKLDSGMHITLSGSDVEFIVN